MDKIRFEDHAYVGAIMPYAILHNAIEFSREKGDYYVTVEQEHYLTENEGHETKLIKGKAKLSDLSYNFNFSTIEDLAKDIEKGYSEEFFVDEVPFVLSHKAIIIDGKEFKYNYYDSKSPEYKFACDCVDAYCKFVSAPSKLLSRILSQKPFKRVK